MRCCWKGSLAPGRVTSSEARPRTARTTANRDRAADERRFPRPAAGHNGPLEGGSMKHRRSARLLLAFAAVLPAMAATAAPTVGGCPVLPANNVWNARVDTL